MSLTESFEETEEYSFLSLKDGLTNCLNLPGHTTSDGREKSHGTFVDLNLVKNEAEETAIGKGKLEKQLQDKTASESDDKTFQEEQNPSNCQFNSVIIKGYTVATTEKPVVDIESIFKENYLYYEKQRVFQEILNKVIENMDTSLELKEVQKFYLKYLHSVAELETYNCSQCDYQTIHKSNLRSHLFLIHNQEMDATWFQCPSCAFKSKSNDYLKRHCETKHQNKTIQSKKRKRTKSIADRVVVNNPKKVSKNKCRECDLCSFKTNTLEIFKKHKASHIDPDNPNRFLCYLCSYGNCSKMSLSRHLLEIHQVVSKRSNRIKELKCDYCSYTCNITQYLSRHLLSHKTPDEVTMLNCTYCDFKTKYRMSFNYHVKNHKLTDEQLRMYMCEVCSKRFKQKAKLDLHVLTHKSMDQVSQIFKCAECPFQAKIKRNFEMHLAVHKEPEFVCDVCGHRSKRKDTHNRHVLTHKRNEALQTFKCSLCAYETHIKCYLTKHFKKHMRHEQKLFRSVSPSNI